MNQEQLLELIDAWNAQHPIGTLVKSDLYPNSTYATRSEAMCLFDEKAVVYIEGFNGYFELTEIHAVSGGDSEIITKPVAVIFPGQGAQKVGMGAEVFPLFPDLVKKADAVLGYSIETLCLEDPEKQLNLTQFTQPALYIVSALNYLKMQQDGELPQSATYFAGHSLGEYNALLASGAFDFESGLRLAIERGRLMAEARDGGMAAVMKITPEQVRAELDELGFEGIDLANFNTPSQTVISGPKDDVEAAVKALKAKKIRAVALKVSGAFHSRYMKEAQDAFSSYMQSFNFNALNGVVVANSTAQPYDLAALPATLSAQISSSVRWIESINFLLDAGVEEFVEVGSNILTKMVTEIKGARD